MERAVLDTLTSIFSPLMVGLGDTLMNLNNASSLVLKQYLYFSLQKFLSENSSWDVKLALDYKYLLRRIKCSVLGWFDSQLTYY